MEYEGTLYRPPSEANSLIIQVTIGCAHNTCTFCNMYKQKKFRIRREDEILADLREAADSPYRDYFDRVFFADGVSPLVPGIRRFIKIIACVVFLLLAVISIAVPGRHFARPESCSGSVQQLDEKKSDVQKLAGAAVAASAAIIRCSHPNRPCAAGSESFLAV